MYKYNGLTDTDTNYTKHFLFMKHHTTSTARSSRDNFFRWVTVLLVLLFAWQVFDFFYTKSLVKTHHDFDRTSSDLNLINPRVVKYEISKVADEVLEAIAAYLERPETKERISSFGFYVRDLDSGYGFGINENEKFIPASLLKVMNAIAYYKASEADSTILEKKYLFEGTDYNLGQAFKPSEEMQEGVYYTVEELIFRSLKFSDNNASEILLDNLDEDFYRSIFVDLGVAYPVSSFDKTMTPKLYANIFRILYNATFLGEYNSQKILKILNEAEFNGGIQAGINGYIDLSNKFGERVVNEGSVKKTYLHDCGIVYTKHPYVLCMMTEGLSAAELAVVLKDVSRIMYEKMKY